MDRAEAIRYLEQQKSVIADVGSDVFGYHGYDALCSAVDALREYELARNSHDVTQACEWIGVSERLPRYGERVLITEGNAVFEASLSVSHKWVRCGIGWAEGVTHWMPMPEPPEKD